MACTLCLSKDIKPYFEKTEKSYGYREYLQCSLCNLIFQNPQHHVDLELEKKIYNQHENSLENTGYVEFLKKLTTPLLKLLKPKGVGLDFGSGPGPTLSQILKQSDHKVANYDPIFCDNKELLKTQYDFVTCTEVVEHFFEPHKDLETLYDLLKPNGHLGLMTQTLPPNIEFKDWWYHRDPTHVSFYSPQTFDWISRKWNLNLVYSTGNVFIFQKI